MKVTLELDKEQLQKIIADETFTDDLREKAAQALQKLIFLEEPVKTWNDLGKLLNKSTGKLSVQDLISILTNSGWTPPQPE